MTDPDRYDEFLDRVGDLTDGTTIRTTAHTSSVSADDWQANTESGSDEDGHGQEDADPTRPVSVPPAG